MEILIDAALKAGRSAVERSRLILLPPVTAVMRPLEAKGVVDWRGRGSP